MIILASEDVGLADPHALSVVISCAEAFHRIGFPEGNFPLAHACLYLATAPKSNTTLAFFDALKEVDREDAEVPNHLKDASRDAESFGHGAGYIYPHAYRDHWAAQQYLPSVLRGRTFYIPSIVGYESKIREDVLQKRELQAAIVLGESTRPDGESLSWSQSAKGREGWFRRLESGRGKLLLSDRDAIFGAASVSRHDRILIPLANDGLLLWESLRRTPEGLTAALVDSPQAKEALQSYAAALDQLEKPEIAVLENELLPAEEQAAQWFPGLQFEHILLREPWKRGFGKSGSGPSPAGQSPAANNPSAPLEAFLGFATRAKALLANKGKLCLLCSPPPRGERISRIMLEECKAAESLAEALRQAEDLFFKSWTWDEATLTTALEQSGFTVQIEILEQNEERLIGEKDIEAWFDTENSRWGSFIVQKLTEKDFFQAKGLLQQRIQQGPLLWRWKSILLRAGL